MHTILYLGSTTDLHYERELLAEWGKRSVQLAACAALPRRDELAATGTDGAVAAAPMADPLAGADAVVVERGSVTAADLAAHPSLTAVVILDERTATVDVAAATAHEVWVTRARRHRAFSRLPFVSSAPSAAARRHALQDALAAVSGERPSGRVNEL